MVDLCLPEYQTVWYSVLGTCFKSVLEYARKDCDGKLDFNHLHSPIRHHNTKWAWILLNWFRSLMNMNLKPNEYQMNFTEPNVDWIYSVMCKYVTPLIDTSSLTSCHNNFSLQAKSSSKCFRSNKQKWSLLYWEPFDADSRLRLFWRYKKDLIAPLQGINSI